MKKLLLLLVISSISFAPTIDAKRVRSFKSCTKKSYTKKAPYAGLSKVSKATGKVKTKVTQGYFKPSKGKYVNPYARS